MLCHVVKTELLAAFWRLMTTTAGLLAAGLVVAADGLPAPASVMSPVPEAVAPPLSPTEIEQLIDAAVEDRLRSIPRPRYIPATDRQPPLGAVLIDTDAAHGEFPFSAALSGYVQLRWFELLVRQQTGPTPQARHSLSPISTHSTSIGFFSARLGMLWMSGCSTTSPFLALLTVGCETRWCRSASEVGNGVRRPCSA